MISAIKLINYIRYESMNHNIVFTEADKRNTVIAINKTDYISRIFISAGNCDIYKKNLPTDFRKRLIMLLKKWEFSHL